MFDYETLRFIWWLLIGVILVVFMISDGFDMGIGCLLPLVARNDDERRIVINSVGAHWEGNQVWLILAGGALFAAWPRVYAAAFSGFYVAMILVLCSLFFRPLAFDYRGKIADARWRKMWDAGLVIGSLVPPVVFGIAFGNLLLGVPFAFTPQLRYFCAVPLCGGIFLLDGWQLNGHSQLASAGDVADWRVCDRSCLHGAA